MKKKWINLANKFLKTEYLRVYLMVFLILFAAMGMEEMIDDVFYDPLEGDDEAIQFDKSTLKFLANYRTPLLNQIMTDITALGSISVLSILCFSFIGIAFSFKNKMAVYYMLILSFGSGLWSYALKNYFDRSRPDIVESLTHVTSSSFPSGHSFAAASIYTGLAFIASQYARSWKQEVYFYFLGFVAILAVGVSRLYLGVHYPSDVVSGVSGGFLWAFILSLAFDLRNRRNSFKTKKSIEEIPS